MTSPLGHSAVDRQAVWKFMTSRWHARQRAMRTMTEIGFGIVVSRVLARMDIAENERRGEENTDPYKAMQMYKAAVADEIRAIFDEVEASA